MKLFPHDKLAHFFYGASAAGLAAALAMLGLVLIARTGGLPVFTPQRLALAGGVAAGAVAALIGWGKERRDAALNAAAVARGEAPPHQVSRGDLQATAAGALPVALPLLALALLGFF